MRRTLMIAILATVGMVFSVNAQAQGKASKDAKKEAKSLIKQGYKAAPGKLPLERQLDNAYAKQYATDDNGDQLWYTASQTAIGGNYAAAVLQASNLAKADLAGQIQTNITQLVETQVANSDMGQQEAASLVEVVSASKSLISETLGRITPLVEISRTLPNKNVEAIVTLGYSVETANRAAQKAIRDNLSKKSENLAKQLDELLPY